jgi:hypothetical protein
MPFLAAIPMAIGGAMGASAGAAALTTGLSAIGTGVSTVGSLMNQRAANKGPQAVFPEQQGQYLQMLAPLASTGAGTLNEMARTGMPTDVGPAWEAMMTANKRQTQQGYDKLLGSFGQGGLRYSSASMTGASDYLTQSNANFLQILSNYTMQAQEAARARQMSASQFGVGSFGNAAMTMTGPKGSVAGAGMQGVGGDLQTIALMQMLGMGRPQTGPQATPPWRNTPETTRTMYP